MTISCPSGHSKHEDQCCKHCKEGTYVSADCGSSSPTKCETCVHETYMAKSNYLANCFPCRLCNLENQYEVKPCQPNSDRKCECKEGFYCIGDSDGHCNHCVQAKVCAPGTGVITKHTRTNDTICKPCIKGTFSNETDSSPCRMHTNCEALGRHLKTPGTVTTDAVCGDFIQNCPWVIPGGLLVGLTVTILITLIIVLLYQRAKYKSQRTVSISVSSQSYSPPVLPPDVIKHPNSPELQMLFHKGHYSHDQYGVQFGNKTILLSGDQQSEAYVTCRGCYQHNSIVRMESMGNDEVQSKTDCCLECDGITMTTITASEKYDHTVGYGGLNTSDPSILQSEPQEDEWPGV